MAINKDQVRGRVKVVKGAVKQVTGKLVGSKTTSNGQDSKELWQGSSEIR